MKDEMICRWARSTWDELEIKVFSLIRGFCSLRRHFRLGSLSPAIYEQQLMTWTQVSKWRALHAAPAVA
jgi:hypothetical protein